MIRKAGKKRLLTGKPRQEERRTQQMLQSRIANAMSGSFKDELNNGMESLIQSFENTGSTDLFGIVSEEHRQSLEPILEREWRRASMMGGERILGAAKCMHGNYYIRKQSQEEQLEDAVQNFIATAALTRVTGLVETTVEDVRSRIESGRAAGSSVDEIAAAVRTIAPQLSAYRSMMIARTESHAAFNAGAQAGAEASDLMLGKEWIASGDSRTRDGSNSRYDHEGANGETVNTDEFFTETGERLMYPGDPRGSSGNVIHCRCGRGDVLL